MSKSILFQDNESAMKMENNERDSCTGQSRHINIRYFFSKDQVNKGELKIEYYPTKLMITDYITKPLQGQQFEMFRYLIMEWKSIKDILSNICNSVKEHVENDNRNVTENANMTKLKITFKEALMTGDKTKVRNRSLSKDIEEKSKKEDKKETN